MVSDFIFDGMQLSDLGYIAIQQDRGDLVDVSAMKFETIKAARSDINRRVSYTYDSNYSTTFSIMKSSCDNPDDDYMNNDEISELTRWLARKQYKWFREIDDDEENNDEIWYMVQNQVRKEYAGDKVCGLEITVEANTPYGFTRETTFTSDGERYFSVAIHSDEEGYIYPSVQIVCGGAGDLVLHNENENRSMSIRNCSANEVITIDGDTLQITSSIQDRDFTNDFNYVFPRFVNEYGKMTNEFEITLVPYGTSTYNNVDCKFKYREIRKVGF